MWKWIVAVACLVILGGAYVAFAPTEEPSEVSDSMGETALVIGGERDEHGCLTGAGYTFDATVGACVRDWELTPDIRAAAQKAVGFLGAGDILTVVAFNAYEEPGAYDIMFEKGLERERTTVSLRGAAWFTLSCRDGGRYTVIERSRTDRAEPGSDFLLKPKGTSGELPPCVYEKSADDIELVVPGPVYFLGIVDGYLMLDEGTAPPPRTMKVYDIMKRDDVYTDLYLKPVASGTGTFTYWQPVDTEPTTANCPDLASFTDMGIGAGIEREVTLMLSSLTLTPTGTERCTARQ